MRCAVTLNTYPRHPGVKRAEVGDVVRWGVDRRGHMALIREPDSAIVYSKSINHKTGECNQALSGVIAQVKKHGYVLEIEEIPEEK